MDTKEKVVHCVVGGDTRRQTGKSEAAVPQVFRVSDHCDSTWQRWLQLRSWACRCQPVSHHNARENDFQYSIRRQSDWYRHLSLTSLSTGIGRGYFSDGPERSRERVESMMALATSVAAGGIGQARKRLATIPVTSRSLKCY